MAEPVSVAVIPCAGAGTRLRPATRVVPKPLIPIIDRPAIQYVVEEARDAGCEEIILVVDDRPGDPVLSHFVDGDPVPGFEGLTFTRVLQPEPLGLGDAVLQAREAVGDRPFLCLLSDMFPRPGQAFARRMVDLYEGDPVLALRRVTPEWFDRYGIVATNGGGDEVVIVTGAVEKPGPTAPSDLALIGRYVLPPVIFDDLAEIDPGHGGEIQLTDAIDRCVRRSPGVGLVVEDVLLDMGRPEGILEATAVIGLSRPELADRFRGVLEELLD